MADTLDVLTLTEAKLAVNQSASTTYDTELASWITGVSRRLDRGVGPIVQRTITSELHDGGGCEFELNYWPATSVTTVTEYAGTNANVLTRETNSLKPSAGYLLEAYEPDPTLFGPIVRRRASNADYFFAWGRQNVAITYVAGRAAATATVDEIYKRAASLMLQNLWNSQRPNVGQVGEFEIPQGNWPRFTVPNAVRELLRDEWQDLPGLA